MPSSSSLLLRASDFCRPKPKYLLDKEKEHKDHDNENGGDSDGGGQFNTAIDQQQQEEGNDDKEGDHASNNDMNKEEEIRVNLQVISDSEFQRRLNEDLASTDHHYHHNHHLIDNSIRSKDIHNTALINSTQILRELSLVQGNLAVLRVQEGASSSENVLVTLRLDQDSITTSDQKSSREKCNKQQLQQQNEDIAAMRVLISTTLAATLGCARLVILQQSNTSSMKRTENSEAAPPKVTEIPALLRAWKSPLVYFNQRPFRKATRDILPSARKVRLQPLGRPVLSATPTSAIAWPPPPNGIIVQESSILQVQDPPSKQMFYYEVVCIQSNSQEDTLLSLDQSTFFKTTSKTQYIYQFLQDSLPDESSSGSGSGSSSNDETQKYPTGVCRRLPQQVGTCPHPDLPELTQALLGISTRTTSPERIFSIIGTDSEHDVRRLVQVTASALGMRCLSVPGLAAFAAANGHEVTTGSLMDQMEGLQMALNQAMASRPCVLHFVDFDSEFSSLRNDPSLREEHEQRLWSVLMDALDSFSETSKSRLFSNHNSSNVGNDSRYTPSVLVVISTAHPLSKISPMGPLLQNMVYRPIHLSYPDEAYAIFLWKEYSKERERSTTVKNQGMEEKLVSESIQHLLPGRPVQDIRILHEQWYQCAPFLTETESNLREHFDKLCNDLDRQRRMQANKSSSAAKVANVKWEDVGGLAQVRREIMDTIELPLMYPHYFPNGGRSGILLYGPPGTGKTLVAKAVATECNIPFLSVKGPELLGSYVGESEANVRAVFDNAREAAVAAGSSNREATVVSRKNKGKATVPSTTRACLVFFDELDSLAPRRDDTAGGSGGGVMDRVVATLAAELDKGRQNTSTKNQTSSSKAEMTCYIFVLGATNRPDLLDPALLRPGRFDRMVYLGVASTPEDRARILAAQLRNLKFEQGRSPQDVAESIVDSLPGSLTGADLSSIGSGALSRATQRLCVEADREVARRLQEAKQTATSEGEKHNEESDEGEELAVLDEVLSEWDESQLVPIVTIEDLLEASKDVVPSVSQSELEKYERLRDQFSSS